MLSVTRYLIAGAAAAFLAGCSAIYGSSGPTEAQGPESELAVRASQVLQNQMGLPDKKRIPQALVSNAQCVAVFPKVISAGFILGGTSGQGLVSCRQGESGWSQAAPAVYSLSSGSIGLQAGATKKSIILLFQTQEGMDRLLQSNLKLGSQIGITAGPLGFDADVNTAPAPVVSYVASKTGLFAGVSLSGTKLSYKQQTNSRIYTPEVEGPRAILLHTNEIPRSMQPFTQTLQQYVQPSM